MNSATISADIISYTALHESDKRNIEKKIKEFLPELQDKYKKDLFLGRIIQGDYIECAMRHPTYALRIALLLKTFIKSIHLEHHQKNDTRIKYFKEHAIRLAIAVAPLTTLDTENEIIDGTAIYLSGREIKNYTTSNKQKIIIKNTMFFCSENNKEQQKYQAIISLLDIVLARCTSKQCEALFYKLKGLSEKKISVKLNKSQSTISQHLTAAGWHAIEKSVNYYEKTIV